MCRYPFSAAVHKKAEELRSAHTLSVTGRVHKEQGYMHVALPNSLDTNDTAAVKGAIDNRRRQNCRICNVRPKGSDALRAVFWCLKRPEYPLYQVHGMSVFTGFQFSYLHKLLSCRIQLFLVCTLRIQQFFDSLHSVFGLDADKRNSYPQAGHRGLDGGNENALSSQFPVLVRRGVDSAAW